MLKHEKKCLTTIKLNVQLENIESEIIANFNRTSERFYVLDIFYPMLGKPGGHSLNAVVIDSNDKFNVIFVDAWKTSKYTYSLKSLIKRYSPKYRLSFSSIDSFEFLKKPLKLSKTPLTSSPAILYSPKKSHAIDEEAEQCVRFHTEEGIEILRY